jgi:quinol monooxygenase YgiN
VAFHFTVAFHFIVQFEPRSGKEIEFRQELLRIADPTRAEPGCLNIRIFESLREPVVFAIHSEWVDEAAFNLHAQLPHTVRFIEAANQLLTHAVEGLRSQQIGGGVGFRLATLNLSDSSRKQKVPE